MRKSTVPSRAGGVTRRGMLTILASGALAAGAADAASASTTPTPLPAPPSRSANPGGRKPTLVQGPAPMGMGTTSASVSDARSRASASVGSPRAGSEWAHLAPTGSWNVAFISWLLYPDGNAAPTTLNELKAQAAADGRLGTTARAGAVVLQESSAAGDISWCGYVESVTALAIMTVAGDVPSPIPSDQTFVRRFSWPLSSKLTYFYPDYRS